jgi:hypothetical protein
MQFRRGAGAGPVQLAVKWRRWLLVVLPDFPLIAEMVDVVRAARSVAGMVVAVHRIRRFAVATGNVAVLENRMPAPAGKNAMLP